MNKKSLPLKRILPGWALVLALALGACGGGGGGDDSSSNNNNPPPPPTASISSCFTAPSTVTYNITASGVPAGQVAPSSGTSGPMTDNTGQAVTGQMLNYVGAASVKSITTYWKVTSSGVTLIGDLTVGTNGSASLSPINVTLPANMSVGQTVDGATLVGFENVTLAGKTFSNACHMKSSSADVWYAYGYGVIKKITSGMTIQYDGDTGGSNPSGASITACFTVPTTVSFKVASSNVPSGQVGVSRSTAGPMTYNGQAVTGQTWFYTSGSTTYTEISYWTVTSSGVAYVANINTDGTVESSSLFYPQNMSPGQTATDSDNSRYTFVGFETVSLAGKTFSNACHIRAVGTQGSVDAWLAPGYGSIKEIHSTGVTNQYNGDL